MPYRMVLQVFKTIAVAMVLVFVADLAIYLYKAFQLQQRMENLAVSLQRTVMENNYLPDSEYLMYTALFEQIGRSLNGESKNNSYKLAREQADDENFLVRAYDGEFVGMNYSSDVSRNDVVYSQKAGLDRMPDPISIGSNSIFDKTGAKHCNLGCPAEYGDLKYIELAVTIKQPVWGFGNNTRAKSGLKVNKWNANYGDSSPLGNPTTTLYFSYLVPCLHYNALTE